MSEPTTANTPMGKICLTDADCKEYSVPVEALQKSEFIRTMIEDLGGEVDPEDPLLIPNIDNPAVWEKFSEYLNYMCQADYPTDQRQGKIDKFTDFEEQYINSMDIPTLFAVVKVSNFLDCKPLLEATCKAVAMKVKGKTPEEIRQLFGIKNDFTPEEEAQVAKENSWMDAGTSAPSTTEANEIDEEDD